MEEVFTLIFAVLLPDLPPNDSYFYHDKTISTHFKAFWQYLYMKWCIEVGGKRNPST